MPGLEIAPSTSPQVAPQPDENKYYIGPEIWNRTDSDQLGRSDLDQPSQSKNQSQGKSQSHVKVIVVLIVAFSLAVALAVGLGVGLSAQHKQKSSK